MSNWRFRFLNSQLGFDDLTSREEKHRYDTLAPIMDVFENCVCKCKQAYTPFEFVTADDTLTGIKGRCNFRQYIPSKLSSPVTWRYTGNSNLRDRSTKVIQQMDIVQTMPINRRYLHECDF